MPQDNFNDSNYRLSDYEAEALAKKFRATKDSPEIEDDPFKDIIPPSLLAAEHIIEYTMATGLVAPFVAQTGENGRLKKASYEARLGEAAYQFAVGGNTPIPMEREANGNLILPPNSIVFVECDLVFRLPSFIALRFNLSISHVHRGLLLGTGPLVDPGFWGKLCIPIHNLTDEPYEIEKGDGLIWIEFTKTTLPSTVGKLPSGDSKMNIRKFIERATEQVDPKKERIGIRSGISKALAEANEAVSAIGKSETIVEEQKAEIEKQAKIFGFAGIVAMVALIIALYDLSRGYRADTQAQFSEIRPVIYELREQVDTHIERVDLAGHADNEAKFSISILQSDLADVKKTLEEVTLALKAERARREAVEEVNAKILERLADHHYLKYEGSPAPAASQENAFSD
ncbi:MAG: hypothetical protein ABJM82_00165 [Shimia thalassica]|uniref:dCTP deaminase domain-containing protein n=1 Tax=Shimia thalassica TaxID=1715693 RepID=UPI003296AF1A